MSEETSGTAAAWSRTDRVTVAGAVLGVVCAVVAAVLTSGGRSEAAIPWGFAAMAAAVLAGAGAVVHRQPGVKAALATAAVLELVAGSTFFGMGFTA